MAKKLVTDELWEVIEPLLSQEPPAMPVKFCKLDILKNARLPRGE